MLRHRTTELFGVHNRNGAFVVTCHVMADADGDQLHRALGLNLFDHLPQMALKIVADIHVQCGIVHRRAVRNHHQDLALFRSPQHPVMRP